METTADNLRNIQITASILNDLIEINNDRIQGYQKAIENLSAADVDLKAVFSEMADQSLRFRNELQAHIASWVEKVEGDTTLSGKVYRAWMDVKATFAGNDRKAMLESCEFGEDAALNAYRDAEKYQEVQPSALAIVTDQKSQLEASHNLIKQLRDSE